MIATSFLARCSSWRLDRARAAWMGPVWFC